MSRGRGKRGPSPWEVPGPWGRRALQRLLAEELERARAVPIRDAGHGYDLFGLLAAPGLQAVLAVALEPRAQARLPEDSRLTYQQVDLTHRGPLHRLLFGVARDAAPSVREASTRRLPAHHGPSAMTQAFSSAILPSRKRQTSQ